MDNFNYKSLTKDELRDVFTDILPKLKFDPYWHQLVCMAFAADKRRVNLFLDVRLGKTLTALTIATHLWKINKRIFVVCPPSAFGSWQHDIEEYTDLSYKFIVGSRYKRISDMASDADIFIINYEGLKSVYCYNDEGKWFINSSMFDLISFDCMIFDEVHHLTKYNALQSQICTELSKRTKYVIGLTGTEIDKSLLDIFNIQKVVDLGEILGQNFFTYRNKYFKPPVYGHRWVLRDESCKVEILKRLAGVTISFEQDECFDLPKLNESVITVQPTQEFLDIQKAIIEGRDFQFVDERIKAFDVNSRPTKLRELSSGFLFCDGDGDDVFTIILGNNPKIKALIEFINKSADKVIVYYSFIPTRQRIEGELARNSIGFVTAKGGQKIEGRKDIISKFSSDESVKVLLAHTKCASEGFDGSITNTVIFFDPVSSPRIRKQCIGRIRGKNQTKECMAIDLVLDKSVDKVTIRNRGRNVSFVKDVKKWMRDYKGQVR